MFLPRIRVSLDKEAHLAWKFSSVRFAALGGIAEVVQHYLKDIPQEVTQYIDPHVLSWVSTASFLLAILGRVTQVEVGHEPVQSDKSDH